MNAGCDCTYPITFDMPSSYLAKKPDMTLINMIKVDVDTSMRSKYVMKPLSAIKNVLLTAQEVDPAPSVQLEDDAPPPAPVEKDSGVDHSIPALIAAGFIAACFCFIAKRKRSVEAEGGQKLL